MSVMKGLEDWLTEGVALKVAQALEEPLVEGEGDGEAESEASSVVVAVMLLEPEMLGCPVLEMEGVGEGDGLALTEGDSDRLDKKDVLAAGETEGEWDGAPERE